MMTDYTELTARLRTWADLSRVEAWPVLQHDLAAAADALEAQTARIQELEAESKRFLASMARWSADRADLLGRIEAAQDILKGTPLWEVEQ